MLHFAEQAERQGTQTAVPDNKRRSAAAGSCLLQCCILQNRQNGRAHKLLYLTINGEAPQQVPAFYDAMFC